MSIVALGVRPTGLVNVINNSKKPEFLLFLPDYKSRHMQEGCNQVIHIFFSNISKPLQKTRLQKGEMKQIPFRNPINISCYCSKLSGTGDRLAGIVRTGCNHPRYFELEGADKKLKTLLLL